MTLAVTLGLTLAACTTRSPTGQNLRNETPLPGRGKQLSGSPDGLVAGHRLMATGQYELALDAYTRAAGKYGLTADVLSALGSANLKLGRLRQAKTLLEAAVAKDPKFVPAWNNLGVTLMEIGQISEARRVFRNAYALDNGNSDEIRNNLRLAIAKTKKTAYVTLKQNKFELVRRGSGHYLLLATPETNAEQ